MSAALIAPTKIEAEKTNSTISPDQVQRFQEYVENKKVDLVFPQGSQIPPPDPVTVIRNIQPAYVSVVTSDAEAKLFIYNAESGNNPCKVNGGAVDCNYQGSRAYGLGQALPAQKLLAVCPTSDYACEDAWFSAYAINRYGSWQGAYQFWVAHKWW